MVLNVEGLVVQRVDQCSLYRQWREKKGHTLDYHGRRPSISSRNRKIQPDGTTYPGGVSLRTKFSTTVLLSIRVNICVDDNRYDFMFGKNKTLGISRVLSIGTSVR